MPIYEYRCEDCGRQFEVIQKFSDEPLTTCASCRGKLSKLISQASFQLKGSGWYVSDYARKSESKPDVKKDESASKPSTETSSSSPKTSVSEK